MTGVSLLRPVAEGEEDFVPAEVAGYVVAPGGVAVGLVFVQGIGEDGANSRDLVSL